MRESFAELTEFCTEPDSLANLVTNLNVAKCANAESAYLQCVNYAVTQLNLPNVAMYIDAGTFSFSLLFSDT
jgi:cellulase/cellobiase CelA1